MTLAATVTTLDDVPEALHEFYTERDGTYVLDVNVDSHPSVKGLKDSQARTLKEKKAAAAALEAFGGLDPEAAKEALDKVAKMEADKQKAAGDWDAREAALVAKYDEIIADRDAALDSVKGDYRAEFVTSHASRELAKAGGDVDLLLPQIERAAQLSNGDGGLSVVIVDPANPDAGGRLNSDGKPMTMSELVAELADKHPGAFKYDGGSGDGSRRAPATSSDGIKWVDRTADVFQKYGEQIADGSVRVREE